MRGVVLLIVTIGLVAAGKPALCQSSDLLDEMMAREAAKKALLVHAKSLQEHQERLLKPLGMSVGGINKLVEGPLGEGYRVYQIDSSGIEKLTGIQDVTKVAKFRFIEFPVLIDDDTILLITMAPVPDSVTKEIRWEDARFGDVNGIGKRAAQLSKMYPRAMGYELIHLYVNYEADFMIIRKVADHMIFWGFRSLDGHLWGVDNDAFFCRNIPENEFLDILRSHVRAKAR